MNIEDDEIRNNNKDIYFNLENQDYQNSGLNSNNLTLNE
jgi:hypothetical protein